MTPKLMAEKRFFILPPERKVVPMSGDPMNNPYGSAPGPSAPQPSASAQAGLNYPLTIKFKILAIAPQVSVFDATGNMVCYVQQKLFRFKEQVTVYRDNTKSQVFCEINADRIIDFSAFYQFTDAGGNSLGGIRRKGWRSLWKAHYELVDEANQMQMSIQEENPFAKVMDSMLGEIPVLGLFSGYMFNPKYLVTDLNGQPVLRITKSRSFLESTFQLEALAPIDPVDELRIMLGTLMLIFLERARG